MSIFSFDSKFNSFMSRLADVCLLNLLWIAFSIPIVTAGAATCAAFSVTLKMLDGNEGYIARSFVKAFKSNFKQGTILQLITCAGAYALYLDAQMAFKTEKPSIALCVAGILSAAVVWCALVYAYPLAARYENTLPNHLRNSFALAMRNPLRTFILLLVCAFEVAVFSWNVLMMIFGALAGPMILVYTVSAVARKIFDKAEKR